MAQRIQRGSAREFLEIINQMRLMAVPVGEDYILHYALGLRSTVQVPPDILEADQIGYLFGRKADMLPEQPFKLAAA